MLLFDMVSTLHIKYFSLPLLLYKVINIFLMGKAAKHTTNKLFFRMQKKAVILVQKQKGTQLERESREEREERGDRSLGRKEGQPK